MSNKKIIYDFGASYGEDIPYYLLKADLVVAIEAVPELCELIRKNHKKAIEENRLIVINAVATVEKSEKKVDYYVNKHALRRSQFGIPPKESNDDEFGQPPIEDFNTITLKSKNALDIIKEYGEPYYIKIDLEGYDPQILKYLLVNDILPPYISAESHTIDIYCILVTFGYNAFKLVRQELVPLQFTNIEIETLNNTVNYSFAFNSSGPMGNDIHTNNRKWMNKENVLKLIMFKGLGWVDLHASRVDSPSDDYDVLPQLQLGKGVV